MSIQKPPAGSFEKVRAEQLKYNAEREAGYRERALKLYPWICGRCAREFERIGLSELTVHHVDHNHDNNPLTVATGSYCVFTATMKSTRSSRTLYAMAVLQKPKQRLQPIIRSLT